MVVRLQLVDFDSENVLARAYVEFNGTMEECKSSEALGSCIVEYEMKANGRSLAQVATDNGFKVVKRAKPDWKINVYGGWKQCQKW